MYRCFVINLIFRIQGQCFKSMHTICMSKSKVELNNNKETKRCCLNLRIHLKGYSTFPVLTHIPFTAT